MQYIIDKDIALLYGVLLGDGCLSLVYPKNRKSPLKFITITGSSKDDLPFFEQVIHPILRKLRGKNTNIKFRKNCNAIEFNFTDYKLFDFIHSLGFPLGEKLNRLFIPAIFYDLNLVKYVVSGFFSTDGSLVLTKNPNKLYPRLESYITCEKLLKEVYTYLISIGMKGAFYTAKRVNDSRLWNVSQAYRIQFNGKSNLLLYEKLVGFSNPKYQEKFESYIKYDKEYLPISRMAAPRIALGTPSS